MYTQASERFAGGRIYCLLCPIWTAVNKLFLRTDWNEWRRNVVQRAIDKMVREISSILSDVKPSIYLYGSSVLDD